MSELPRGWVVARLGEIGETRLGKMLSAKARGGADPRPYLRNKNVQWGRLDLDDLLEMDFSDEKLDRFRVLSGDLLVCEGGEVGRAAIWRGQLEWIGYQKALHRVRPLGGVSPEYLLYGFMWLAQTRALEPHVTGSTIKHLPQEDLRLLPIPLPPLNEHRRIVAAIEEHLSRLDAADASLVIAIARIRRFRDASLEAGFTNGARRTTVGEVAALSDGPFGSNLKTSHYVVRGPRVIRLQNIGDGVFRDEEAHITGDHFARLSKHAVVPGDVVVASLGDEAPRACLVPDWLGLALVKADCIRARPTAEVDGQYLMWALNSRPIKAQAAARIKGIGRPRLGLGGIRALEIPLPPLEEQRRIVQEIEARLSALDALRASIERAQRRSRALRAAVLARAFRGELVPQDPSDEPASVLLDRIRAERAANEPTRPRSRSPK